MDTNDTLKKFVYKDFDDKKVLGEGFFNQVYYAKHPELGSCVLKIASRNFYANDRKTKQLEDEARCMFAFEHQNIIRGYGVVMEPEHLCLVYEYADYGCLSDALRRISIPWTVKIKAAYQICLAIDYLHNRPDPVIHRNLKSTNVLFTKEFDVKVSDFIHPKCATWVSHATTQKEKTERKKTTDGQRSTRKGFTLAHLPPEVIKSINLKPDESYDAYSFGVILWEMLTETKPFEGWTTEDVYRKMIEGYEHPHDAVKSDRPTSLFDLMVNTLDKNPRKRPSFQQSSQKLKPIVDQENDNILQNVNSCRDNYEDYKKIKKELSKSGLWHTQPSQTNSSVINDYPKAEPIEIVDESEGHIGSLRKPVETVSNTQTMNVSSDSTFPPTADENEGSPQEKELRNTNLTEVFEHSGSYTETADETGDVKATPFMDESSASAQRQSSVNNYYINSDRVNLNVIENQIRTVTSDSGPSTPPLLRHPSNPNVRGRGSQRLLTKRDETTLVDSVGNQWRFYARALGFGEGQIDAINHDYDREGLKEKIFQVTYRWRLKQGGQASVGNLIELLIESNLIELANMLDP